MSEQIRRKYEELYERDAHTVKEDTLKELSAYEKSRGRKTSRTEEPRAVAGPYSYTVGELMAHVEKETQLGRDAINAMRNLKATLARGGK